VLTLRQAWPFRKPVDWRGLRLTDYPTVVKDPIDLGIIKAPLPPHLSVCQPLTVRV
jgi:hypothetical protein